MNEKPVYMSLGKVPALVESLTGIHYGRISIYRWAHLGRQNLQGSQEKLQTVKKLGRFYTTQEWVENFIRNIG